MTRYDTITEVGAQRYDHIEEVAKFNPYHDAKGRFASANSYTSFTYKPGQGAMRPLGLPVLLKKSSLGVLLF